MGLLSGIFSSVLRQDGGSSGGGGGFLGTIAAGPSAWAGSADMWSGLSSRTRFEVATTDVFGGPGRVGQSLLERAQAAQDAGELVVIAPTSDAAMGPGEGVIVMDRDTGDIFDVWDGGSSWSVLPVTPRVIEPDERWSPSTDPLPGPLGPWTDAGAGGWGYASYGGWADGSPFGHHYHLV